METSISIPREIDPEGEKHQRTRTELIWSRGQREGMMLSLHALLASTHVASVFITPSEQSSGELLLSTKLNAAAMLREQGFVVLKSEVSGGLVPPTLIAHARTTAHDDLENMLQRLERVGIDHSAESFSFAECVHRSRKRYDLCIDQRRSPPDAPWAELSAVCEMWATPCIMEAGNHERVELAVDGLLTSRPGAPAQRFHTDGAHPGSYQCLLPLVSVGMGGAHTGTEFWRASHTNPVVKDLAAAGELAVLDAASLPIESADSMVQPCLAAGDLLVYDYRVVHRGPANPGPNDRPIFYTVWGDPSSAGDGANFPRRSLADLERRKELFGL